MVEAKVDVIDEKNGFAKRLKEIREKAGLTQRDLAEALEKEYGLKVTASSISGYEKGKSYPPLPTAKAIAERLNISLDYLCDFTGKEWRPNKCEANNSYRSIISDILDLHDRCSPHAYLWADAQTINGVLRNRAVLEIYDDTIADFVSDWEDIRKLRDRDTLNGEMYSLLLNAVLDKDEYKEDIIPF